MLKEVKKEFNSGKCTTIIVKKIGFLSGTKLYEVRLFTTKPKTFLEFEEGYQEIAKEIVSNHANWLPSIQNGYTHTLKLSDYPNIKILIKEID